MFKNWSELIHDESKKPYFRELQEFLLSERKIHAVYPPENEVFTALNLTPIDQVKVVILGQDPYHGKGQAHGLAFSVREGVRIPPSLLNIYKEIESDLGTTPPLHGDLTKWAREGVLLLNNVLTVRDGEAGSHHGKGWEKFTDRIIEVLSNEKRNLVFILWGLPSQKKASRVNQDHHHLIISPHPSPLSSYRGFLDRKSVV